MAGLRPPRSIVARPLDKFLYVPVPMGGIDTDSTPLHMDPNHAPQLDNWNISRGRLKMRNPFTTVSDLALYAGSITLPFHFSMGAYVISPTAGTYGQDDRWLYVTRMNTPGGAGRFSSPIHVPWTRQVAYTPQPELLRYSLLNLISGSTTSNPTIIASGSVVAYPGQSSTKLDGTVYFTEFGGTAATFTPPGGGTISTTSIIALDSSATMTKLTLGINAPTVVKGYQGRLWALGGRDTNAAANYSPNALYYSNPITVGTPISNLAANWTDPVTTNYNRFVIDANVSDPGSGLAVVNQRLIIFRRRSTYVMSGAPTSTSAVSIQLLSREVGCIDPRSIVETDHGCYFMSHKGLMLTTGSSVVDVSGMVTNELRNVLMMAETQMAVTPVNIMGAILRDGTILFTIDITTPTSPAALTIRPAVVWSGVFNPATGVWTKFTSSLFQSGETYSQEGTTVFIPNPSFEADTVGVAPAGWITTATFWQAAGATCVARPGSDAVGTTPGGANIAKITTNGVSNFEGIDTGATVPVAGGGNPMTVTCWVQGAVGGEKIRLGFGDGTVGSNSTPITCTTAWQQVSVTLAPNSLGSTHVAVTTNDVAHPAVVFYVDLLQSSNPAPAVPRPPAFLINDADAQFVLSVGDRHITVIQDVDLLEITPSILGGNHYPHILNDSDFSGNNRISPGVIWPIPATWVTGAQPSDENGRFWAQIIQFFLEGAFQHSGGFPNGLLTVTALRADGTAVDSFTMGPVQRTQFNQNGNVVGPISPPLPIVQRAGITIPATQEFDYIQFKVQYIDTSGLADPTDGTTVEVYGLGLEFQQGRSQ